MECFIYWSKWWYDIYKYNTI